VQEALVQAQHFIEISDAIEQLARSFVNQGLKPLDALHLACAVDAQADYFCTCDDRFYRRAKQIIVGKTRVVSPLELIEVIEP
jgi:predicted nucleic acid-binding protein